MNNKNDFAGVVELVRLSDVAEVNKLLQYKDDKGVFSYRLLDCFHTESPNAAPVFIIGKFKDSCREFFDMDNDAYEKFTESAIKSFSKKE